MFIRKSTEGIQRIYNFLQVIIGHDIVYMFPN